MPTRMCVVPACGYRRHKNEVARLGLFQCPKDEKRMHQWQLQIPGITVKDLVCEKHFHPSLISRYFEKSTNSTRTRLKTTAVPTIFSNYEAYQQPQAASTSVYNNYMDMSREQMAPTPAFSDYMDTSSCGQSTSTSVSSDYMNMSNSSQFSFQSLNDQIQPKIISLGDAVSDLSASKGILMKIKQEEIMADIKMENPEDYSERYRSETDCQVQELTVFEQIQINRDNYSRIIPELWSINQLVVGTEDVIVFSKECTVSENKSLVVIYEKTAVLGRSGSLHYSVHGNTLNCNDSAVEPYFPSQVKSVEALLNIITKFNEVKVCQGVCTSEFEVDKDCTVYRDDLGFCRHVSCTIIADTEQCNPCYEYSQYLAAITLNNVPVLGNQPIEAYNHHQIY